MYWQISRGDISKLKKKIDVITTHHEVPGNLSLPSRAVLTVGALKRNLSSVRSGPGCNG
jgi:hypothetical protein